MAGNIGLRPSKKYPRLGRGIFIFVSAPLSGAGLYLNYALGGGLYLNYAHLQIHLLHASFPDKGEHALANGVAAPQPHQAFFKLMPNSAR